MGAATGAIGTARAQYHLRQTFVFLDMHPVNRPEVMIGHAAQKFDALGNLTDEKTQVRIRQLLEKPGCLGAPLEQIRAPARRQN